MRSSTASFVKYRHPAIVRDRVLALRRAITPTGWTVILLGVSSAVAGQIGGYRELLVVALFCLLVLVLGAVLLVTPSRVEARLELRPAATTAGRSGRATLWVTNRGRRSVRNPVVVVPMRSATEEAQSFARLPVLKHGQTHRQDVVLPAMERGIAEVGPVAERRSDPLGLFLRLRDWTNVADLAVRPRMIPVGTMATGHVPEHDATASEEISMSDLSFHALREYVPGDDLRHVHWRSSARAGVLHVRQYHDTRRSHVVVVVDRAEAAYPRPQDFELALSIAASVVARLAEEAYPVTFACGTTLAADEVSLILDATCRAVLGPDDLEETAVTAARSAPGSSQLILVSGVRRELTRIAAAREAFPPDVQFLGVVTGWLPGEARDQPPRGFGDGPSRMLRVRRMAELPAALAASVFGPAR
ncbi:DUF58 domain-containing protein [Nocardioides sp. GXZ039]|uniref:DUF58 domain-containing protein n=1 Tax=Nocardioides sp. GXZ039 TaxID=3136018 RepID=UPI0030F4828E